MRLRSFALLPIALLLPLAACQRPAAPATAASVAPRAPAQLGLCAGCHGSDGIARQPDIPDLAGQHADYLFNAMRQYRDGTRRVPLMQAALGPLDSSQMRALADWYAAQPACATRTRAGR